MPTTAPPRAPSMPTVGSHREACPEEPSRQEVWTADLHARDGAVSGQTGVAHCMDCGRIERVPLKKVQAYLDALRSNDPQEDASNG